LISQKKNVPRLRRETFDSCWGGASRRLRPFRYG
jgi:hypothetical protein